MKWYMCITLPLSTALGYALHEHPWYTIVLSCVAVNAVFVALYCIGYWSGINEGLRYTDDV